MARRGDDQPTQGLGTAMGFARCGVQGRLAQGRVHQPAIGVGMAQHNFDPRWHGCGHQRPTHGLTAGPGAPLRSGTRARQRHSGIVQQGQRHSPAPIEGVQSVAVGLAHVDAGPHTPVQHRDHAAQAQAGRCVRQPNGIAQVAWAVGVRGRGWAHGRGQHDGLAAVMEVMQQASGFFQRVGAVGDDDGFDRRILHGHVQRLGQGLPHGPGHVLAVDLRDLLRRQGDGRQLGHRRHELRHTQLGGLVGPGPSRVGARAGDGAAGAQDQHVRHGTPTAPRRCCAKTLDIQTVLYRITPITTVWWASAHTSLP